MDNVKTAYTDNITWAIKENGELWGLGSNECGKLGDGTEENRNEPQKIMDNVRYVKDGGWYTLAITENDELWGWGDNEYGQLGDGTVEESLYPKKIMDDVREVLPHNLGVLAIKNRGGNNFSIEAPTNCPVQANILWILQSVCAIILHR